MKSPCAIITTERLLTAVVKIHAPMNKLPEAQRSARATIDAALPSLDVGKLGRTCTLWRPPVEGSLYMEPGTMVSRVFAPAGGVVPSALPEGRTAHFLLKGPFDGLPGAWKTLFDWCAAENLKLAGLNWEIYSDWAGVDPAGHETNLYALLA